MCCMFLYVYQAGPNECVGWGPSHVTDRSVPNGAQCRMGPDGWKARPIVHMICMVCGILGNSLSFVITVLWLWFQALPVRMGRARLDRSASTHVSITI